MNWNPEQLRDDFLVVAKLGGLTIKSDDISIETLTMPHKSPSKLPKGKWRCIFSLWESMF